MTRGAIVDTATGRAFVNWEALGGPFDLLRLRRDGARELAAPVAPCEEAQSETACEALALVNTVLASRGASPMRLTRLAADVWRRGRARAADRSGAVDPRKRRLFAILDRAPAPLLPASDAQDALSVVAPVIDPRACVGCDACAQVCPTDAIARVQDAYLITPDDCDGCAACVDVCEDRAVTLETPAPAAPGRLSLRTQLCSSCATSFHEPVDAPANTLCRICRVVDHRRNLHQVLE